MSSTNVFLRTNKTEARFTKYLTTILRQSYDNAKVTINLRRTSNSELSMGWVDPWVGLCWVHYSKRAKNLKGLF